MTARSRVWALAATALLAGTLTSEVLEPFGMPHLTGYLAAGILAALQTGSLAIVSVLVGLYPLATLLLARIVGGERMTRLQLTGAGLAIAASAVLGFALGGAA